MCGIVGYTEKSAVKNRLIEALELLEYRGYDSAGVAFCRHGLCEEQEAAVYKCTGRVGRLRKLCEGKALKETCGIGHTRWATHGGVNDQNAHPHCVGRVTLVHNGILENYEQLTEQFGLGERLTSTTDSEVAAAVLNHFYESDPLEAIGKAVAVFQGTYAFAILFSDLPGVIYAVRQVSPIVLAMTENGAMLSSDISVLFGHVQNYMILPQLQIARLEPDHITLFDLEGKQVSGQWLPLDWEVGTSGKGGYPFFMEKEIMEQPQAIRETIMPRIKDGLPTFEMDGIPDQIFLKCNKVCIAACGTAMHAGLVGKNLIQSAAGLPVEVEMASEFLYSDAFVDAQTLVMVISQSGETIDTLEALKFAKRKGAETLSIVNVRGSAIARESDYVIYTSAGPEIAVASTKAYTTQLAVLYLLAGRMALVRGTFGMEKTRQFVRELRSVPEAIASVLLRKEELHLIAKSIMHAQSVFMIGRGLDYAVLLEGSLKLKEISYIHSEAYASGELKHGTLALITEDTPVIAVITQQSLQSKEISNIREVQARGAGVIVFLKESCLKEENTLSNSIFILPAMEDEFMVLPASIALQLLAYYVSFDKGLDVDKPRNLAKVVTVE